MHYNMQSVLGNLFKLKMHKKCYDKAKNEYSEITMITTRVCEIGNGSLSTGNTFKLSIKLPIVRLLLTINWLLQSINAPILRENIHLNFRYTFQILQDLTIVFPLL